MKSPEYRLILVGGLNLHCEVASKNLLIAQDPRSSWWIGVDQSGKRRAAFMGHLSARLWCKDADLVFDAPPESNQDIKTFHAMMTWKGWRTCQRLGFAFVWELLVWLPLPLARFGEAGRATIYLLRQMTRPAVLGGAS